jgi:GNAT superfamily N-acetyltransferase
MFRVKPMQPKDFSFAVELANTMDWQMAPEDFKFNSYLEPEGCLVLFEDSKPLGIATCISYGKVGWFGNLIVKEEARQRGAGSFLVKHAINYLQGKGVETIGLYAYPNLQTFYGNLGFKADMEVAVFHTLSLNSSAQEILPKIGKSQFQTIIKFDKECFGGDRTKLLESIILEKSNLAYYLPKDNKIVGYVASTVYETMAWIGPLICKEGSNDAAVKLLKAVLGKLSGKAAFVALPKRENALIHTLTTAGFTMDFSVVRMYFGASAARNCIYLAESLERG